MPKTFLFATNNQDKFEDLGLVFKKLGIKLRRVPLDVAEGVDDILENAKLKALETSQKYPDQTVVASDGGVLIPYLGDKWNHVLTKRLGGMDMAERFTEKQRAEALLKLMKGANGKDREVVWEGAVAIAKDSQVLFAEKLKGEPGFLLKKIPSEFKSGGFWLGYLWYVPEAKTYYMNIPLNERFKHSVFKQRLYKKLKNINFDFGN